MGKTCYKCKVEKPIQDFNRDKTRKSGLSYLCKTCKSTNNSKTDYKKKYAKHRIENLQRQKKYRIKPEVRLAGLIGQAKRRAKAKRLDFDLDLNWAARATSQTTVTK